MSDAVNNFLDVDDTTKDQLSEVLALIDANKGTLESLTTSKISVSDIVNNLTTNSESKVLSAAQGVVIKGLIDALEAELNSHENDTTKHITSTERTNWNTAKTHADSVHVTGVKGSAESSYRTGNVNITPANIGLGNVNNTSDADKPISAAQQTAIDLKMNLRDPDGSGSFSLNRRANTVVGASSFAEGNSTAASGMFSHAEGRLTTAVGTGSHAEGIYTVASGTGSHAEGGYYTFSALKSVISLTGTANSTTYTSSFVDMPVGAWISNNMISAQVISIDKINSTITLDRSINPTEDLDGRVSMICSGAFGDYSHSEGICTTAYSEGGHSQGRWNVYDEARQYAHIVGNGSEYHWSNAHTIDWDGNAWFSGDVYVGSTSGTNKDEGSVKLATEAYVDIRVPAWTDADEGAILQIVNGTPTWVKIPNAEEASF